jgi:hypothetical protein
MRNEPGIADSEDSPLLNLRHAAGHVKIAALKLREAPEHPSFGGTYDSAGIDDDRIRFLIGHCTGACTMLQDLPEFFRIAVIVPAPVCLNVNFFSGKSHGPRFYGILFQHLF